MDNQTEELQIIKTVGEDGEEIELKLLDIVSVEGSDYALLLPADEDADDEDAEVVLMKMKQEDGEYIFETIEDDEEFNMVAQILSEEEECDDGCGCGHHHHRE